MIRALPFRVGDVVKMPEQLYCHGQGDLTLRIVELGRREQHGDGLWINLRGIDLSDPRGPRQRRVLARIDAVRPAAEPRPIAHVPVRPSWNCAGCGQDWPCPDRRRRLLERYARERNTLHIYLGMQLTDAISDLRHLPAATLHARFFGWLPTSSNQ